MVFENCLFKESGVWLRVEHMLSRHKPLGSTLGTKIKTKTGKNYLITRQNPVL